MEKSEILFSHLGKTAETALKGAEWKQLSKAKELRFAVNRPIQAVYHGHSEFLSKNGKPCSAESERDFFSQEEIQDIFLSLCEHSVHSYKQEISQGYLTIEGGYRAGICGTAVYEKGEIIHVKDISSINLRLSHEIKGCADAVFQTIDPQKLRGILIIGPPGSGKTTLLRDIVRQLSNGEKHLCVVDERMEIAGMVHGITGFDLGVSCDVLNGYKKSDGILSAVRSMSPDIILCDEFGDEEDLRSCFHAMKSGVAIIATMHAENYSELLTKDIFEPMRQKNIFHWLITLNRNCQIAEIREI